MRNRFAGQMREIVAFIENSLGNAHISTGGLFGIANKSIG